MNIDEYKNLLGKKYKIFGTPLTLEVSEIKELYPDLVLAFFKDSTYVCNVKLLRTETDEAVIS